MMSGLSIGGETTPFTGVFDGNNYTINDLYINAKKEFNPDTSLLSSQRYRLTKIIPDYL